LSANSGAWKITLETSKSSQCAPSLETPDQKWFEMFPIFRIHPKYQQVEATEMSTGGRDTVG